MVCVVLDIFKTVIQYNILTIYEPTYLEHTRLHLIIPQMTVGVLHIVA